MAFRLLIARGNSEGQQFVVVQAVFRIGRGEDNDVVLSDAGVSREHTRIFENLGRPWIEDLGSANGTLVNGERIDLPRELKTGDALAIGAALINFVELEPTVSKPGRLPPPVSDGEELVTESGRNHLLTLEPPGRALYTEDQEATAPVGKPLFADEGTQPVASPLGESPSAEKAHSPVGKGPTLSFNQLLLTDIEASSNSLIPLELSGSDFKPLADATAADARPLEDSTVAPARQKMESVPARARSESAPVRHQTDSIPVRESQSSRSRRRRLATATLGAQAAQWWGGLSTRTQALITAGCALVVTGLIIGLFQFFRPAPGAALPSEPDRLKVSSERIRYSFGLGDGVDYPREEAKEFTFDFVTPTEAAVLIHYLAQDIDRDEVAVMVNGVDVGFVPPDIGVPDREIETLIPQRMLKRGEKNTLVFDNVRNPPGRERWRVADLWLELLPVPPSTPADALRRAREMGRQAGQLYAQREVGSQNVFRSWKAYRQTWQLLLGLPEEQRTSLFEQARRKADEIGQELDRQCGALMLEAKKQMELKDPQRAKEILMEVAQYFPTTEHRCHTLANEKLDEYQL